jgi:hypothetical protein
MIESGGHGDIDLTKIFVAILLTITIVALSQIHPKSVHADILRRSTIPAVVVNQPTQPIEWTLGSEINGVDVNLTNTALQYYQSTGMTKLGASFLVGDFLQESRLVACGNHGDGGLSWGFAQWHPDRRNDMPCDFSAQLAWAVNVEMARHTPTLKSALYDPNATVAMLEAQIYKWEVYGVQGNRFEYGQQIYNQISNE